MNHGGREERWQFFCRLALLGVVGILRVMAASAGRARLTPKMPAAAPAIEANSDLTADLREVS